MNEPMTNERRKRIEAWLRAKPAVRLADTHPSPERCSDIAWECLEEIDRLKDEQCDKCSENDHENKYLKEENRKARELYHTTATYLESMGPCENIVGEADYDSPYCDDLDCLYCNVAAAAFALIGSMPAYDKEVKPRRAFFYGEES